jgi:hypothetical protein
VPIRGDVSQISPPIRILLVLSIAVLGVYMFFLRPKAEVAPPPAPAPNTQTSAPAQTGAGKAVEAAQNAAKATNSQLQSEESVDGVDSGEGAAGTKTESGAPGATAVTAATSSADVKGLPKPIAKAIRKHKVLVLLFWNGKSADDVAVHDALKKVDRWDGRVYVGSASIKKISKYGRIARGVDVEQSPTVVVADPVLHAETLVGYVDAATIDQAVVDALRNSTGLYTSAYLRKIDQVCAHASSKLWAIPDPDHASQVPAYLATGRTKWHKFEAAFKAVPAPKKFRALKRATVADNADAAAILGEWRAYLGETPGNVQLIASLDKFAPRWNALAKRYNRRMDAQHVLACGSDA